MQAMYDTVVDCIKKPPATRTDEEAEKLFPWFVKKQEALFQTMKPEIVKDIIKNCLFSERQRDDVIMRQGELGDCFYIILSGSVSIYINTDAVPDDPEETQQLDVVGEGEGEAVLGKKKELDRTKFGKFIVTFGPGKSFGEMALINKHSRRAASIIVDELTHLVVVDRDLYNRSLRTAQEADFRQRIDFVNNSNLFNRWMSRYKRQAAMSLRKEQLVFDMPIVRQGEPVNGLCFILKGQAKVVVDLYQHYTQYPQLNLKEDPEELDKKELIGEIMEENSSSDKATDKADNKQKLWDKPLRRQGYSAAEHRQAQKHLEISLIGPGELIGDIEQGMDLSTYAQTIVCTQPTEIYILDAKNFERLVQNKRNANTMLLLREKAEVKLMSRVARSLDKQVPLIRVLVHRIMEQHKNVEKRRKKHKPVDTDYNYQGADVNSFIPQRGPLINLYGPGTVFHRNRLKRAKKEALKRAKQTQQEQMKGMMGRNALAAAAMFGIGQPEEENIIIPPPAPDEDDELYYTARRHQPVEFKDWETSSEHLGSLEERLRSWYEMTEPTQQLDATGKIAMRRFPTEPVIKLRRFKKDDSNKIFPGTKIYLRPRRAAGKVVNFEGDEDNTDEDEDDAYCSGEEEVFITAQSPIRLSRLGPRETSRDNLREDRREDGISPLPSRSRVQMETPSPITEDDDAYCVRTSEAIHSGGVPRTESAAEEEGDRDGSISHFHRLDSPSNSRPSSAEGPDSGCENRVRLPQISQAERKDGGSQKSSEVRRSAISRVSSTLPREAADDPVGYVVDRHLTHLSSDSGAGKMSAQSKEYNRQVTARSAAERRTKTIFVLKDILAHRLVPDEIRSAINSMQHKGGMNSDATAPNWFIQSGTANEIGAPQLRSRSILLPSRVQGMPSMLPNRLRDQTCQRCKKRHFMASLRDTCPASSY